MQPKILGTWQDDPFHFRLPTRRSFLHVGLLAGLGLSIDHFFRLQAGERGRASRPKEPSAQSVIHIFLPGGLAHQDSFDPKPYAPLEYRGELGVVRTRLEGIVFSEHLKQTAQVADKLTLCRSMTHGEAAHERGMHNMFTGYKPSPALVYPSMGSVVSHEYGPRNNLPPYVCVPGQPTTYAGPGYLSSAFAPFSIGSDPANPGFTVQDLNLPAGVDDKRFGSRRTMLEAVNAHFERHEKADPIEAMDTFYSRAYGLISSKKAREAFNIAAEPAKIRDEYGRNAAGQRMLLARRLVEAGVRFVSLTHGSWDLHAQIRPGLASQLPEFDKAFASLIRDLDRRGLLKSTLVLVSSEFGRTPKINATAGRDHWPKVFSVVLAGGGVKQGHVSGASDSTATEPDEDPLQVEDLAKTVFHLLGISGEKQLMSPGNRPVDIVRREGLLRKDIIA
jgi:hypothetical protein